MRILKPRPGELCSSRPRVHEDRVALHRPSSSSFGPRINQSPPRSAPAKHPQRCNITSHHLRRLPDTLRPGASVHGLGDIRTTRAHAALQVPGGHGMAAAAGRPQEYGSEEKITENPGLYSACMFAHQSMMGSEEKEVHRLQRSVKNRS
jgi:hypothetical protein